MTETLNRRLLHGARHHDRDGVFVTREGERWVPTPDWRADRHSIRIALALQERFRVEPGDVVALGLDFGPAWMLVERAVWGLGGIVLPAVSGLADFGDASPVVWLAREPSVDAPGSVRGVVTPGPAFDALLEHGGVLDTPERATRFRARAREVPPEALASLEERGAREVSQGDWAAALGAATGARPDPVTLLAQPRDASFEARVPLYAAWAGGTGRIAFADSAGRGPEGSVTLPREEP